MKKIALTLLTLGICLTSLGQQSQAGWGLLNNSDTPVTAWGYDYNGHWQTLFMIQPKSYQAGWPLYAGTHNSLQYCWMNNPRSGGCLSDNNATAIGICYTEKISSLVTIGGNCGTINPLTNQCSGTPTLTVFSPC